jgi:predicted enzyme related to lactoylglutathione lyase
MTDAALAEAPTLEDLRFKLNFFKLNVADIEKVATFYKDVFGFEEQRRIDVPALAEIMMTLPGETFTLVLLSYKDARSYELGTGYGPLGFLTRNVAGAVSRALAHGGSLVRDIAEMPGAKYAFVADPEGHQIELMQFLRPAA